MPGDTKTGFTGARKYAIDESSPYYNDCIKATGKMEKDEHGGKPPVTAALAILKLCRSKDPPAKKTVGLDYKFFVFLKRIMPQRFIEFLLRAIYV